MIVLGKKLTEPRWLDIDDGLRIKVRPSCAVTRTTATTRARIEGAKIGDTMNSLTDLGFDDDDFPGLMDQAKRDAIATIIYAAELGQLLILEWEGVQTPDRKTAPINRESIYLVMRQFGEEFLIKEAAMSTALLSAGNV